MYTKKMNILFNPSFFWTENSLIFEKPSFDSISIFTALVIIIISLSITLFGLLDSIFTLTMIITSWRCREKNSWTIYSRAHSFMHYQQSHHQVIYNQKPTRVVSIYCLSLSYHSHSTYKYSHAINYPYKS